MEMEMEMVEMEMEMVGRPKMEMEMVWKNYGKKSFKNAHGDRFRGRDLAGST